MARFLPVVLVVGLLGGSAAAFAVTERLKLERSPIFGTRVDKAVSPYSGRRADIIFKVRKSDDLSLAIVDSRDHVVRALISSHHVRPGPKDYKWNGRDDSGEHNTRRHNTCRRPRRDRYQSHAGLAWRH